MFESLDNVDWGLLHRQKRTIVTWLGGQDRNPPLSESAWGIVHLLDALQDDAVAAGRWAFPDGREPEGGA